MKKLHGSDMAGSSERDSGKPRHGTYKNDVDEPKHQRIGKGKGSMAPMQCCADYKSEASDQAFGQSGKSGLMSDEKKIHAQFHPSYTDDAGY